MSKIDLTFLNSNIIGLSLLAFISIIIATLVITTKNPIVSVLFLISLFLIISIYLMSLGFNFLGLSYLLVYIGAVSILFLFILMLINVRISELSNETYNSLFLSIIIAFSFSVNTSKVLPSSYAYSHISKTVQNEKSISDFDLGAELLLTYNNTWDNKLADNSYIFSIGNVLYTNFCILLIIASIILLLAMVGCILVTKKNN